ncbi:MAG: hypothetical protein M1812_002965 [Candelaria pacifica]|nr:MAG: hypothetical protein M1812_002965 [Candelaria pacifica]
MATMGVRLQPVLLVSSIALFTMASSVAVPPPSQDVINLAGGPPPTLPPPPGLSAAASERLQLGLYIENLEADYFNFGLSQISTWGLGGIPANVVDDLRPIGAQEKIHVATVAGILGAFDQPIPQPCKYNYPVSSLPEFLGLGSLIGSVGFGSTMDAGLVLAQSDPGLLAVVQPTASSEARHNTFFRLLSGLIPSPNPADTILPGTFAKLYIDQFVVPNSCPNPLQKTYPALPPLTLSTPTRPLLTHTTPSQSSIQITWSPSAISKLPYYKPYTPISVAWINQLNAPIYTSINQLSVDRGEATIKIPAGLSGVAFAVLVMDRKAKIADDLVDRALSGVLPVQVS